MRPQKLALALLLGVAGMSFAAPTWAASHREAPLIALDPAADNTDVYFFVSYDAANLARPAAQRRATLIANFVPGQDPADGPNYFGFDDNVLYRFHIDNNADGRAEDVVFEIRFKTESRPIAGLEGAPLPFLGGALTGGITALDGPGAAGLTRRQTYSVTMVKRGVRTPLFGNQELVVVPSNIGFSTTPNYEQLAAQGLYSDAGMRVFAGPRAETFYIDLGAVFDTLNLRRTPPALTPAEDANDFADPFGSNRFSGFNVQTIALEVPIALLTGDGKGPATTAQPVLGVYASSARARTRVLQKDGTATYSPPWIQVSRMANPLVNELIIGTPAKDRWNATDPADEALFQDFYKAPVIAAALQALVGPMVPATPRTDLMSALLKYPGQTVKGDACGNPCSELLRLDTRVAPTPASLQNRLGMLFSADKAGWPNGRRPNDDVTDIALRVVGGANYIGVRAGDGVNRLGDAPGAGTADGLAYGVDVGARLDVTANGIAAEFPFLPTPHDGRDRRHVDCDELGANLCN